MKERPILFNGAMVRAILPGTKTQTRRVVKLPHMNSLGAWEPFLLGGPDGGRTKGGDTIPARMTLAHTRTGDIIGCPLAEPGDRLWVREAWRLRAIGEGGHADRGPYVYRATENVDRLAERWKPSIHMPRGASRITLEVTDVRVERLQAISEAAAVAEGIRISSQARRSETCYGIYECQMPDGKTHFNDSAYDLYRILWQQINGPGSWDANPWVWVVEFMRVNP